MVICVNKWCLLGIMLTSCTWGEGYFYGVTLLRPILGQNFGLSLRQLQVTSLAPHVSSTGRSPASHHVQGACDTWGITACHMRRTEELRRIFPTIPRVFGGFDASLRVGLSAAPFLIVGVFLAVSCCKYLFVVLSMFNRKRRILNSLFTLLWWWDQNAVWTISRH